jgi:thiopurine S-methyltransferase
VFNADIRFIKSYTLLPALDDTFWSERYLNGHTGWDVGEPTTPLRAYVEQLTNKHIDILIPGCGNAWEAKLLCDLGFSSVTLIDISSHLVALLRQRFQHLPLRILHGDFFEHEGAYDLILEQTFFCALNPELRHQYVSKMHALLKPGGKLVGVLFNRLFDGGPPFGGSEQEYRSLLEPVFASLNLAPCKNSISARMNTELFLIAEKHY